MTAFLTAIMAAILGGSSLVARVETRPYDGNGREMRVIDIWREASRSIPEEAPAVFTQVLMVVLLITALVGIAYIVVAILRFPR